MAAPPPRSQRIVAAHLHNRPRRTAGEAWHPDYLRPAADKTMSAEELGSEGRWFGDERNGLFGNAPTQFGELREDFKPRSGEVASDLDHQIHPYQDDGTRPPVTMETASTGKPDIYGIKVPVQVISKSFIRFGSRVVRGFCPRRLVRQRRSLLHLSQVQPYDRRPLNWLQTCVHQSKRNMQPSDGTAEIGRLITPNNNNIT